MLEEIRIKNFKSISDDTIALGRVNVFIGENGSGKSNILEALMFASIAETYRTIDADILFTNGVRVSKPSLMLSSFEGKRQSESIGLRLKFTDYVMESEFKPVDKNDILSKWTNGFIDPIRTSCLVDVNQLEEVVKSILLKNNISSMQIPLETDNFNEEFDSFLLKNKIGKKMGGKLMVEIIHSLPELKDQLVDQARDFIVEQREKKSIFKDTQDFKDLNDFIIYNLNTEALRGIGFQQSKKGIHGETLDILVGELNKKQLEELKEYLYTITWLNDVFIDKEDKLKQKGYKLNQSKSLLYFKDKYMMKKNNTFSVENANEGVLHILFYLALLINSKTSRLFAIDNIETALNPHLCQHLMGVMCQLAKKHEKQMLITTHNPAILDGLDLFDDEVRLFEVKRLDNGNTKTRRIELKPEMKNEKYKLSELWMRGYLGAISQNF